MGAQFTTAKPTGSDLQDPIIAALSKGKPACTVGKITFRLSIGAGELAGASSLRPRLVTLETFASSFEINLFMLKIGAAAERSGHL